VGAVPSVVPNILGVGDFAVGRAGWADAATIVPWAVHVAYDDRGLLAAQLPSMQAHVGYLQGRRHEDGLLGGEFQFGDWLDPDAPPGRAHEAKTSSDYLANAFFSHSARIVAEVSRVLGDAAQAQRYAALADDVATLTWDRWRQHALTTQTGCAVALELGIAPVCEHEEVGGALAELVREADGRIATGFLGTPLVLPALTRTGHLSEAYLMLLRREVPSWLYQVERGATTVWERWDAIRADGSIHDGRLSLPGEGESQMLSFNHYAYGAVIDWVYRTLAGLAADPSAPGYRHVVLAPRPVKGIEWVDASIDTGFGRLAVRWRTDGEDFVARYTIPFGVTATFEPPAAPGATSTVDGEETAGAVTLGPGEHAVRVVDAVFVDPALTSLS
jgi:alpha-L-rhamnosidase